MNRANAKWTGQRAFMSCGQRMNCVDLFKNLARVVGDLQSNGCDPNRAVGAFKQCHTQFLLEFLDLSRQRRLTDKTAFCRLAEMEGVAKRNQVA